MPVDLRPPSVRCDMFVQHVTVLTHRRAWLTTTTTFRRFYNNEQDDGDRDEYHQDDGDGDEEDEDEDVANNTSRHVTTGTCIPQLMGWIQGRGVQGRTGEDDEEGGWGNE